MSHVHGRGEGRVGVIGNRGGGGSWDSVVSAPACLRTRACARCVATRGLQVVTFTNLGRDAALVSPCPLDLPAGDAPPFAAYPHLAAFVRRAPAAQVGRTRLPRAPGLALCSAPSTRGRLARAWPHRSPLLVLQVGAVWGAVGRAALARLGLGPPPHGGLGSAGEDAPLWISTSGLGVYWLHVRLDARPKYYTYAPFRQWPYQGA
jgi:hypothetical protein